MSAGSGKNGEASRDGKVVAGEARSWSFGAAFVPRGPGRITLSDGVIVRASLLDPVATGASLVGLADIPELSVAESDGVDLLTIMLLLALLLLAAEWALFRTARIP